MKLTTRIGGTADLRRQLQRISPAPRRAFDASAEEVEALVEDQAGRHTKTGRLFASITKRREGEGGWFVGHQAQVAPYALFVHWGTRPHPILPSRKKVLRWPAGSRFVFARKVDHPGYRGDPWLVRAAAQAPLIFQRRLDALLKET